MFGRIALIFALSLAGHHALAQQERPQLRGNRLEIQQQNAASFARWREAFAARALRAGIRRDIVTEAMRRAEIDRKIVELDGAQAEFTKTVGAYMRSAVSGTRIRTGQLKARALYNTLVQIQRQSGVDARVVMGIWGIETNFGGYRGNSSTIDALATLAWHGRRRDWAERELIAVLKIVQNGDIGFADLTGSWAGAMGHTQFMPTSYLAYAVDFTGDGRRNIWSEDPSDALASTANYLRVHGWKPGQPWGVEVILPRGFDFGLASIKARRPMAFWISAGVRGVDGQPVPNHGRSGLWLPQGAGGPAFLTFDNFNVIRRYNPSNSYALAVGRLGDRIFGAPALSGVWPKADKALGRAEVRALQARLTALGFDTKGADGRAGPNTEAAIRAYQRRAGLVPDGYPSRALYARVVGQ